VRTLPLSTDRLRLEADLNIMSHPHMVMEDINFLRSKWLSIRDRNPIVLDPLIQRHKVQCMAMRPTVMLPMRLQACRLHEIHSLESLIPPLSPTHKKEKPNERPRLATAVAL
jgi:hypothetical protein